MGWGTELVPCPPETHRPDQPDGYGRYCRYDDQSVDLFRSYEGRMMVMMTGAGVWVWLVLVVEEKLAFLSHERTLRVGAVSVPCTLV